jgi:hypothetical protein
MAAYGAKNQNELAKFTGGGFGVSVMRGNGPKVRTCDYCANPPVVDPGCPPQATACATGFSDMKPTETIMVCNYCGNPRRVDPSCPEQTQPCPCVGPECTGKVNSSPLTITSPTVAQPQPTITPVILRCDYCTDPPNVDPRCPVQNQACPPKVTPPEENKTNWLLISAIAALVIGILIFLYMKFKR